MNELTFKRVVILSAVLLSAFILFVGSAHAYSMGGVVNETDINQVSNLTSLPWGNSSLITTSDQGNITQFNGYLDTHSTVIGLDLILEFLEVLVVLLVCIMLLLGLIVYKIYIVNGEGL